MRGIPKTLAILATMFVGVSFAQEPAKVVPNKPVLGELPAPPKPKQPTPPVPRSPDEPRPLGFKEVRLFWVTDYAGTVPVRWTVTPIDAFALADTVAVPKGAPTVGILPGEERAKAHYPPEDATNVIAIWGVAKGRVLLTADGVKDNNIVTLVRVLIDVDVQGAQPPPIDPPKPPVDPPVDPTPVGEVFYYVVRPNGPASPKLKTIMENPAWDELRKTGTVKEATLEESTAVYQLPAGTVLPCVVTLLSAKDKSKVISGPVVLPETSEAILALKVKK